MYEFQSLQADILNIVMLALRSDDDEYAKHFETMKEQTINQLKEIIDKCVEIHEKNKKKIIESNDQNIDNTEEN